MNTLGKSSLPAVTRRVTLRDFVVFQVKLALEGVKDLVAINLSIVAMVIDIIAGSGKRPRRFYAVMRLCQRFDRWLRLYSAKGFAATGHDDWRQRYLSGLAAEEEPDDHMLGRDRALGSDADTLIDKLEDFVQAKVGEDPTELTPLFDKLENLVQRQGRTGVQRQGRTGGQRPDSTGHAPRTPGRPRDHERRAHDSGRQKESVRD